MKTSYLIQTRHVLPIVTSLLALFFILAYTTQSYGEPIIGDPLHGENDPLMGSKHDFTGLNDRAGVTAMSGVAFSDYGNPCVYCHIPPSESGQNSGELGGIVDWNRFKPSADNYQLNDQSQWMDSKVGSPSDISLLCLSCHDGSMSVDMVVFKPENYNPVEDNAMHMRLNASDDLNSCGKCHNGVAAHDISVKVIGSDLRNDHPISMRYAGLDWKDPDFTPPDTPEGFDNGVRLYAGKVECASCHNVHNPENDLLLRVRAEKLCQTCHTK